MNARPERGLKSNRTFDKTNIIRQMPQQFGEAAKRTLESLAYGVVSTAGNYTASATVGLDKQNCQPISES